MWFVSLNRPAPHPVGYVLSLPVLYRWRGWAPESFDHLCRVTILDTEKQSSNPCLTKSMFLSSRASQDKPKSSFMYQPFKCLLTVLTLSRVSSSVNTHSSIAMISPPSPHHPYLYPVHPMLICFYSWCRPVFTAPGVVWLTQHIQLAYHLLHLLWSLSGNEAIRYFGSLYNPNQQNDSRGKLLLNASTVNCENSQSEWKQRGYLEKRCQVRKTARRTFVLGLGVLLTVDALAHR